MVGPESLAVALAFWPTFEHPRRWGSRTGANAPGFYIDPQRGVAAPLYLSSRYTFETQKSLLSVLLAAGFPVASASTSLAGGDEGLSSALFRAG